MLSPSVVHSKTKVTRVAMVALALLGAEPSALAAPEDVGDAVVVAATPLDRPWAEGVSQERQTVALRLYNEGNALFEESRHAAALAKYREALESWDHPAIRYNAAVALILLDQPLAAHESLERALRHGEAPFAADTYRQALTYQKLLRGQLARLAVTCAEPGAEVTLDGKVIFVGPGRAERWLSPGNHQLVARKAGFLPETRSLDLVGGKPRVEQLVPQEIRPPRTVRRWDAWKPWAVMGAGAAVALAGVPFLIAAKSSFDRFDAEVAAAKCPTSQGCDEGSVSSAVDAYDRGQVQRVAGLSLIGVGAAAAITGATLVLLNQPREVAAERTRASLTPLIAPGMMGLSLLVR